LLFKGNNLRKPLKVLKESMLIRLYTKPEREGVLLTQGLLFQVYKEGGDCPYVKEVTFFTH
tara:strand:+ start:2006 stop:2188 length:183 start_codon:yes stop_codon:yes gene_type:complete